MLAKTLRISLLLSAIIVSGCASEETPPIDDVDSLEATPLEEQPVDLGKADGANVGSHFTDANTSIVARVQSPVSGRTDIYVHWSSFEQIFATTLYDAVVQAWNRTDNVAGAVGVFYKNGALATAELTRPFGHSTRALDLNGFADGSTTVITSGDAATSHIDIDGNSGLIIIVDSNSWVDLRTGSGIVQ